MYLGLKYFHILTIVVSVALFCLRYGLMMLNSQVLHHRFLKVAPHVIDTLLLLSGVALCVVTGFIPFTSEAVWLTEKLMCMLAYIALGVFALKLGKNKLLRSLAFLGALGWVVMAAKISLTKLPILMH
ncbi:SirB2 family protein [Vibrio rhizosphaerae]|uniref:SirB2 family protein n=1 Tax=Vibrio rhizosphaerae TaxID=398736 RepID=A0ABU4IVW0_9VIBR|nr:SirB2 family protein [Vibrio rhizosphaerae]MDW6093557.1 SirB2 family protein [Vibrio rhizosphaerae]